MNGSLKYSSTEIQFTGGINKCLAICESDHKRFIEIRIFYVIGFVLGVLLCLLSLSWDSMGSFLLGAFMIAFCLIFFPFKYTSHTKYNVFQSIKNNRIKGIEFKNIEETKSYCNVIFYLEDVMGNIETTTVSSVPIRMNTNPKYQDLIEINLDRGFEITHYFYNNLPYNAIFK